MHSRILPTDLESRYSTKENDKQRLREQKKMQTQNEENEKKEEFRRPIFPLDFLYTMPLPPHTQLENYKKSGTRNTLQLEGRIMECQSFWAVPVLGQICTTRAQNCYLRADDEGRGAQER